MEFKLALKEFSYPLFLAKYPKHYSQARNK